MASHYEASLQRDIARIRSKISDMGKLAIVALEDALRAFIERDRQLAYAVILRDRRIDELEREIDRLCLEFLVRQQPVAKHLRFAYITIKVNLELERIGDYAESIARQAIKLSNVEIAAPIESYEKIAGLSIGMLRDSMQAFLSEDADLARHTAAIEDEVDGLRSAINAEVYQRRSDGRIPMEAYTPLMTIARRFERVSDQAKNICEEVVYMATGEDTRPADAAVWRLVFVDDHNSCRSQIAEAVGHSLGQPRFVFASAGLDPRPVDPGTVAYLKTKGIDISRTASRSVEQVSNFEAAQIVVALSSEARKACPRPSKAVCIEWTIDDPSQVEGDEQRRHEAYEKTFQFLHTQISDLCEAVLGDEIE